jgi:hypothetical protein
VRRGGGGTGMARGARVPRARAASARAVFHVKRVTQRKNSTAKTRQILPLRMHSGFYEVRISKIDPVVTRAPPGMQNMSKIWPK